MLKLSSKIYKSLQAKYLTGVFWVLFCFSTSLQASTDTTNIGISVVIKSACQISVGEPLNEQSVASNRAVAMNSCQLSEDDFSQLIHQEMAQLPIKTRNQTVTQHDGNVSIRVSITAP